MAEQPWLPATWDRQADVVVVGFGAAGAATAITAYEAGRRCSCWKRPPRGTKAATHAWPANVWCSAVLRGVMPLRSSCGVDH